jgi:mycothiol synthase
LYDFELREFAVDDKNPTYLAINQQDEIIGAASLVMDDYHQCGKKLGSVFFIAKLKIFCAIRSSYRQFYNTAHLDKVFLFIPVVNKKLIEMIEGLRFSVERYAFLLVREDLDVPVVELPEGYELRSFRPGQDEENWLTVRNAAFSTLKGSETPLTTKSVTKQLTDDDYLEGGMMILFNQEKPVGVIRGAHDEYLEAPIMNIGPVAILPEFQGRGLGRALLRAFLRFAKEIGYKRTILSVNGENVRARVFYIQEGFKQVEAVVCYQYFIK